MIEVEGLLFRCTYDNEWVEDISDAVVSATVSMDTGRDQTWALDAALTMDGWRRVTPYLDWVAPVLRVRYQDGTVREGQLGLFLVLDSPESHLETGAAVKLTAADPLWLLARQVFGTGSGGAGTLVVRGNTPKVRAVREILEGAVLSRDRSGRRRFAIPDDGERLKRDREWPPDSSRLDVCNELLRGAGFYPLYCTKTGVIATKRRAQNRLKNRHPVRTYSANLPAGVELARRDRPLGGLLGEVIGAVDTTPKGQDLVNEVVLVNDSAAGERIRVKGRITHPNNPRSVLYVNGRRRVKKIRNPVLDDDATAKDVAEALADELSTTNSTVRLRVAPDPLTEFAHETVGLLVWNAAGEPVAVGQYAVHAVTYGFTPNDAAMTIDCGRIDGADDLLQGAA